MVTLRGLPDLNRYELGQKPTNQGRCLIYKARDRELERPVAIKVLRARDPADHEPGFLREARLTARLEHPAIPAVHDLGRLEDGRLGFVMEWIEGRPLAEGSPSSAGLRPFLKILVKACEALEEVHRCGWVHAALDGRSLLVGAFGAVSIIDWSRARRIGPEATDGEADGRLDLIAMAALLRSAVSLEGAPGLAEDVDRAVALASALELKAAIERHLSRAWSGSEERFETGDLILAQGEPGDRACEILSGACEVFREVKGEVQNLGALGPGDTFGEIALVTGQGRSASVRATAPTRVLSYDRGSFEGWLKLDAEAAGFLSFLGRRLTQRDQELYEADRGRRENEAVALAVAWLARRGESGPLDELCQAITPRAMIPAEELPALIRGSEAVAVDEQGLARLRHSVRDGP